MKDYNGMTGEAINEAVSLIKFPLSDGRLNFNYCGDRDYAMSLQLENKISVIWDEDLRSWIVNGTPEHPQHGPLEPVSDWGADPLRCICIVFLMMQNALKELDK